MVGLFLRKLRRLLFYSGWHRLDRHSPDFHEPCDIIFIQYNWDVQYGQTYEFSYSPNIHYEGFIGPKGLFVSTPKHTYWRHADEFVRQYETVIRGKPDMKSVFSARWGGDGDD